MSRFNAYASVAKRRLEELLAGASNGLAVGQLRRQRKLGSTATYRICACEGDCVRVEVVVAPGLRAGQHFKFTRGAVELMELVSEDEPVRTVTAPRRSTARTR
jgi:hypothetical protein